MNISFRLIAGTVLGLLLALVSIPAWSLGLGEAEVQSYLGQPLRLKVNLITRPDEDVSQVVARLASAEDFALIGASREAISVPLRFSIQEQGGRYHVMVTSNLAVNDPIIRLVLEVEWERGRLLREYTLFLDPPTVSDAAPAPAVTRQAERPTAARQQAAPAQRDDAQAAEETAPAHCCTADRPGQRHLRAGRGRRDPVADCNRLVARNRPERQQRHAGDSAQQSPGVSEQQHQSSPERRDSAHAGPERSAFDVGLSGIPGSG